MKKILAPLLVVTSICAENLKLGTGVLKSFEKGDYNVAIGPNALKRLKEGEFNAALGDGAGSIITKGMYNIYINSNGAAKNEAIKPKEESYTTRIGYGTKHCYIEGIYDSSRGKGSKIVVVDEEGKLSTIDVSAEALENLIKETKK